MAEAEKKGWYTKGYGGMKKEEQRQETLYGPPRLWIKPGETIEIILVDDEPFSLYEHNPKINGEWKNWCTCLRDVYTEAPCCQILGDRTRYYTGFYTIVNCKEWTHNGIKHQYGLELLQAKMKTLKKLKRKKEERGSLVGTMYRVTREDDKSPSCGDEFEFVREVDLKKVFEKANYKGKKMPEWYSKALEKPEELERLKLNFAIELDSGDKPIPRLTSFNYESLLAPRTPREVRDWLANAKIDNTDDDDKGGKGSKKSEDAEGGTTGGTKADEDVPF